jgi:hypothetical protein
MVPSCSVIPTSKRLETITEWCSFISQSWIIGLRNVGHVAPRHGWQPELQFILKRVPIRINSKYVVLIRGKYRAPWSIWSPSAERGLVICMLSCSMLGFVTVTSIGARTASYHRCLRLQFQAFLQLLSAGLHRLPTGWTVRRSISGGVRFSLPSRRASWPTQPPMQWVLGLSLGKAAGTWCWLPIYVLSRGCECVGAIPPTTLCSCIGCDGVTFTCTFSQLCLWSGNSLMWKQKLVTVWLSSK